MTKMPSEKDRARQSPETEPAPPKRGNSIVDAAYSAAMFSDRGDQRHVVADADCEAG